MQSRNYRPCFLFIRHHHLTLIILILTAILFPTFSQAQQKTGAQNAEKLWSERVEPLLDKMCLKCHAGVRQRGGLDMRSLETILRGGDRGPAIFPGRPNESRLLEFVLPGAAEHMPPDPKKQVSPAEIASLKAWIAQLPAPKSKLASGKSPDNRWVPDYLVQYHLALKSDKIPPTKLSVSATIDWFLQTDWQRDKIEPARLCDDATFARRLYLDIAGRIPSEIELKRFVQDTGKEKRQRLIAALTTSDDYPRHMRELLDAILMGRPAGNNARERADKGWNQFLEESFRANRSWNEIVRDILVARSNGTHRGADWFLAEKNNSHQAMAEAVAPLAFGVQIKCAQCHNHPLAWEIEQRHYWGLVATFNRSKNVETETGPGVAESATGGFINFANLKKESQPATLVFLNGKSVPETIPAPNAKIPDSPELYLVPPVKEGQKAKSPAVPKFSRREAFAEAVTRDNPMLARAFVNRMWATFLGRGIVHPPDQIDSRHRPSHPELLEWLARDFEQSKYDVRRLVRNLTASRAYQLDSKPGSVKTPPRPSTFARALEKPLSAEQILHSLWIATGNKRDASTAADMERAFIKAFPDVMPEIYNPSLQQALFLSNSPILDSLLKPAPGNLTTKLLALKSNEARIREAFRAVLGRLPDVVELQQGKSLLAVQSPEKGTKNLLWALLTCAEFQVNH